MSYLESVFNPEDTAPETFEESLASAGFRNVGDIMKECKTKLETSEMKAVLKVLKMTRDEACAIYAYLYEARAFEESPFRVVGKALMDQDTEKLKTLRGFIFLLLSALRKLKPEEGECLYRGIDGKWLKGGKSNFEKGKTVAFESFTSTTMNERVATMFVCRQGVEVPVLYEIHGEYRGYLVDTFSKYSQEKGKQQRHQHYPVHLSELSCTCLLRSLT